MFYYNCCFYKQFEFKIRCYRGTNIGNQKQWQIYDVNHNLVQFTTRQFLSYWPQFEDDFNEDQYNDLMDDYEDMYEE